MSKGNAGTCYDLLNGACRLTQHPESRPDWQPYLRKGILEQGLSNKQQQPPLPGAQQGLIVCDSARGRALDSGEAAA